MSSCLSQLFLISCVTCREVQSVSVKQEPSSPDAGASTVDTPFSPTTFINSILQDEIPPTTNTSTTSPTTGGSPANQKTGNTTPTNQTAGINHWWCISADTSCVLMMSSFCFADSVASPVVVLSTASAGPLPPTEASQSPPSAPSPNVVPSFDPSPHTCQTVACIDRWASRSPAR